MYFKLNWLLTLILPIYTHTLSFIALGDWGSGSNIQLQVANAIKKYMNTHDITFIVSLGDNFYENGVTNLSDSYFYTKYENVYNTHVPWYTILGNHDYHGNISAQIKYSKWHMIDQYYKTHVNKTLTLIACDTQILAPECAFDYEGIQHINFANKGITPKNRQKQLEWLKNIAFNKRYKWTFLLGHVGIYSVGYHSNCNSLIQNVFPILNTHKNVIYLHGHDHNLQHNKVRGVNMFGIGSSGGQRGTALFQSSNNIFSSQDYGFGVFHVYDSHVHVEFIDMFNNIIYETSILRTQSYVLENLNTHFYILTYCIIIGICISICFLIIYLNWFLYYNL